MGDRRQYAVLLFFVFVASFFHQVRNEETKCMPPPIVVSYPRTGRSSQMTDYQRSGRSLGFIHQPRIGRSDLPPLYVGANRKHDLGIDLEVVPAREIGLDSTSDLDYEEYYSAVPVITKHRKMFYPAQLHDNSHSLHIGVEGAHTSQQEQL